MAANNPYVGFPADVFWRSAVAERDPFSLDGIWTPKFELTPASTIATAGSCFAQQIGRQLVQRGLNWLNAEPAPESLTPQQRISFSYDLFTFRTGNIYTTPLLEQWLSWGLGGAPPPDEVWEEDGRFFDPFRPVIEPDGFISPAELHYSRGNVLGGMARVIARTDCFVFTLGLTEAWVHADAGYVYPVCPGTVRGRFDAAQHRLRNFDYVECHRALTSAIRLMRSVKPDLKVILTVSPVPLTATASGHHALVANGYTKSTLRAVAGAVADADDGVDYFPSYELITSPVTRGVFYDRNLRTLNPAGVKRVMDCFLSGIGQSADTPTLPPVSGDQDADEVACEDIVLDAFNAAAVPASR